MATVSTTIEVGLTPELRKAIDDGIEGLKQARIFFEYPNLALTPLKDLGEQGNLIHAALLITSEAGRIADAVKRSHVDGRTLDRIKLLEEIGECCWGLNLLLRTLGFTWKQALEANLANLQARYPGGLLNADKVVECESVANHTALRDADQCSFMSATTGYITPAGDFTIVPRGGDSPDFNVIPKCTP